MLNTKKLAFYSAVIVIALTLHKGANAQIVYTPFLPNFNGHDSICIFDLNGEGIIDFNVNPDSEIYTMQDSAIQFPAPIIVQHEDSLVIESANLPPKATFQWYNKYANPIPNANSSYYFPNTDGYYYVAVTDSSGYVTMLSEVFHFTLTDTTPLNSMDDISVSENNNLLKIKFINESYYGYQLFIYNYIGQKVFSYEINSANTIANLKPLVKGLYFASIEKGNKRIVKKIIIA